MRGDGVLPMPTDAFHPADEQAHGPGDEPWWAETWAFDLWTPEGVAACTSLTTVPNRAATWYWTALVRPGHPLVHLCDLHVPGVRAGLEVRTDGLWASHACEAAFEQWTVANEAYAVALDDPADALGRALGVVTPVAFDLEWYGTGPAQPIDAGDGQVGYLQTGSVDGIIELTGGALELAGASASRVHRWGVVEAAPAERTAVPDGAWVPFVLEGPAGAEVLDRVAGPDGWWERRRRLA